MSDVKSLFLTGATGCLGRELLHEILTTTEHKLFLLVRRKHRFSHWDRIRKLLAPYELEKFLGTRVQVLEGDVTLPGLGLREEDRQLLRRSVDEFYHVAALTSLNGSEEDCRRVNIEGTERALELAWDLRRNGRLDRFFYFSTAFVAGSRQTFCAKEDELPEKPAHANFYESSKYAAEKIIRGAMQEGLRVTIFRPSIVVGHSETGEVSEFNVIYPFMKLFAHGILKILPTRPENSFNIVPIDFVINASLAIARRADSVGKTYHLVTQDPPTIQMLLRLKEVEYPFMPRLEMIDPADFSRENLGPNEQLAYQMLEPYLGYLNDHLSFETTNTESALRETAIAFPQTHYEFLKTLIRFAVDSGYLVAQ